MSETSISGTNPALLRAFFKENDDQDQESQDSSEQKQSEKFKGVDKKWYNDNGDYTLIPIPEDDLSLTLPVGVYILQLTQSGYHLQLVEDKFKFGYKVYGNEEKFVNRVVKTFNSITGNLGILLNGVKGTGKTVTAKQICNKLNLPVILITQPYQGLSSYFADFNQNVVVMVDEFEKVYDMNKDPKAQDSLLSLMDGVINKPNSKKLFIFTTNTSNINENMKSRPGRIRYIKTFKNLPEEVMREIVDDILLYKEHKEKIIAFLKTLQNITIDIVKQVVYEVNLHNEAPDQFKEFFNVEEEEETFSVYELLEKPNQYGETQKWICSYSHPRKIDMGLRVEDFFIEFPPDRNREKEIYLEEIQQQMNNCRFFVNRKNYGEIVGFDYDEKTVTVRTQKVGMKQLDEDDIDYMKFLPEDEKREIQAQLITKDTVYLIQKNPPSFYSSQRELVY